MPSSASPSETGSPPTSPARVGYATAGGAPAGWGGAAAEDALEPPVTSCSDDDEDGFLPSGLGVLFAGRPPVGAAALSGVVARKPWSAVAPAPPDVPPPPPPPPTVWPPRTTCSPLPGPA